MFLSIKIYNQPSTQHLSQSEICAVQMGKTFCICIMLPLLHAAECALRSFKILRSFSKDHVVKQEKFSNEYNFTLYSSVSAELCDEYFNLFHRI